MLRPTSRTETSSREEAATLPSSAATSGSVINNCWTVWFRTGDKYFQDEDGYFWYAGRADDLFKVNGRWLSPAEVESALIAHPAVQEAAVAARADDNELTKPAAYVVIKPGFLPDDELVRTLQQWVLEKIGAYKRPRWIEFLPELPKTSTGKLQRFKLRDLAARKPDNR